MSMGEGNTDRQNTRGWGQPPGTDLGGSAELVGQGLRGNRWVSSESFTAHLSNCCGGVMEGGPAGKRWHTEARTPSPTLH